MHELTFDLQNIAAAHGVALAVTGMAIVFGALTLITLFIRSLPWVLERVGRLLPPADDPHQAAVAPSPGAAERVAAIGFALHQEAVS